MAQEKYLGETGLRRLSELIKEDLSGKANLDGSYDSLQAGSAKQLVSPTGVTDTAPYIFRTTAGSANVSDGLAELKSIRGKTITFNQLANIPNGSLEIYQGNAYSLNNDITFDPNHYYLFKVNVNFQTQPKNTYCVLLGMWSNDGSWFRRCHFTYQSNGIYQSILLGKNLYGIGDLVIKSGLKATLQLFGNSTDTTYPQYSNSQIIDLTKMFGPGNEPTSVLEFTRLFPKPYYPFNAGTIKNVQLDGGLKTVGFNALTTNRVKGTQSDGDNTTKRTFSEGEYYVGLTENNYYGKGNVNSYSVSDNRVTCNVKGGGYGVSFPVRIIAGEKYTLEFSHTDSKEPTSRVGWYDAEGNYISASSNTTGKHTAPSNAYWALIVLSPTTYNTDVTFTDIAFHLTHSGSRTGFEPYEEHALHIDTAQYFPDGMNGVGTAYDELTPKVAIKRIGKVDLGTLEWQMLSSNGRMASESLKGIIKLHKNYSGYPNILCAKYSINRPGSIESSSPTDKTISMGGNGYSVVIYDSDYTDATAFKEAMSGVYLYYELKTPEITEIPQTRDINWAIQVSDYGTEEFLIADGHEAPVPHETFYMDNLVDKLRNLPEPSEYQALKEDVESLVRVPTLPSDTSKSYVLEFTSGSLQWTEKN